MMNCIFSCKTFQNVGYVVCRNYAFKSNLKIKWVRPEKIPSIRPEKSGDLLGLSPIDPKNFVPEFKDSKELLGAEDLVKSVFTLENNKRKLTSDLYRELFIKDVQRHKLDYGSMEAKLARMTVTIRRFQEHMEKFPKDVKIKVQLKEKIEKRKKFLKYLRRWDYKRFEWILEKLNLVYKPPPAEFCTVTRKDSLRKLTNIHCENIKKERLEEYRKKLEDQQETFLEKKLENLKFIRKEQQECKVAVTVQEEDLNSVKKLLQEIRAKKEMVDKIRT